MAQVIKVRLIEGTLILLLSLAFWPLVILLIRHEVADTMERERAALMEFLAGVAETKPAAVENAVRLEYLADEQAVSDSD